MDREFVNDQGPLLDDLRMRLEAGETLPFDVVRNATDGMAEVFYHRCHALNGEAADGYTLVYSRIAAYLRPDHVDAILLSASLLQQQGQYRPRDRGLWSCPARPTRRSLRPNWAAPMPRPSGATSRGPSPALTELAETNGDLMMVHLSLGDVLRREERFDEAAAGL